MATQRNDRRLARLPGEIACALLLLFVAQSHAGYMAPVSVDGRDWLQPLDFVDTSWNDVAAVCDPVTGICSGSLNGGSLDGWTWASLLDVTSLFNSFLPVGQQLTPPESLDEYYLPAATEFLSAGFAPTETYFDPFTFDSYSAVNGLTRTALSDSAYSGNVRDGDSIYVWDHIRVGTGTTPKDASLADTGHFFFRGPAFPVPAPGSGILVAMGFAWLLRARRR